MTLSRFPEPPQTEFDADGRAVHPYVRAPGPDLSAPGFTNAHGEVMTQEDRSRESRLAFHAIEALLSYLSPLGLAYVMQACVHRLYSVVLSAELAAAGLTAVDLDPRGELVAFEALHSDRLGHICELLEEIVSTCPQCGRLHGEGCEDALQPGAYVHAASGDSVRVIRVEQRRVFTVARVAVSDREIERVYDRPWFDENFVPADSVTVLP